MVEGEGGIFLAPLVDSLADVAEAWDILGPSLLLQVAPGRATRPDRLLANIITRFYAGGGIAGANLTSLRDLFTDATFTFPHMLTSQLMASAGTPTYCYILAHEAAVSCCLYNCGVFLVNLLFDQRTPSKLIVKILQG
jgi:hypothetical protein